MSTITRLNPEQLHETPGYHHVTIVGTGRLAYLAGQCPLDRAGKVVGHGDVEAQVDQVAANALAALAAVGAQSSIAQAFTTASTLLGVLALGYPGQLVDLDLIAALSDHVS